MIRVDQGEKMFGSKKNLFIFFDVSCVILASIPCIALTLRHSPFKRGFFCNDDTIKYPFRDDTISYQLLCGTMIPLSLSVLVIGECLSIYVRTKSSLTDGYVAALYRAIGSFSFGAVVSQSLTDISKHSVGRLRPHFLDVCRPNWNKIDCKSGGYIENFNCTGDQTMANEGRLSFYSGHSSFSMYCMVFLVLYLQARLKAECGRLLRPTVQFFLITSSLYVGLSRISDHKHHWSDVLTGLIQGGIVAVLTVFFVSDFFQMSVRPIKEEKSSHTRLQDIVANGNHYGSTS